MSINSMNSRFAMAERMSIPQIQQSVQSGSLPAYVGVPLLEQKMKEQQKAAAMAQLAQAQQQAQQFGIPSQTPIAQGIMEKASGIDDMPSNLPVSGYNDGGIVAFAEGGDAEDFDYEEYQDEQDAEEYNNMLRAYMAEAEAAGIEGIPIHQTAKIEIEKKADGGIIGLNEGGIPRYQEQGLVEDQGTNPVRNFFSQNVINPTRSAIQYLQERNQRMRNADPDSPEGRALAEYAPREIDILESLSPPGNREYSIPIEEQARNLGARVSDLTRPNEANIDPRARPYIDRGMFSNLPPEAPEAAPEAPATVDPEALGSEFGIQGILARQNAPAAGAGGAGGAGGGGGGGGGGGTGIAGGSASARERPKSAFEEFIANIKEERAALNKQKQDDKYMALLTAGLGMMSGTSPNAFANIGQGAQAGVAQYGASAKQRAAERAALNKNLLMGQRYQSMEDIAGRTADINEARYKDALAARAAGSGDAASLKQERLLDQRESAISRAIKDGEATVGAILKRRFGDNPYALTDKQKADYATAERELTNQYVSPSMNKLNQLNRQRFPDIFDQSPQQAPPTNRPPLSSFNR